MRIGCSLLNGGDMKAAADLGFDYVEFMGKYLVSLQEEEFKALCRRQKELALPVLGINGYCPPQIRMADPGFSPDRIREYARKCAERAARLGVSYVGIGSPGSRNLPVDCQKGNAHSQMEEFLRITAEEFAGYGMTVCLEALADCYCNFINRMEEAAVLVKECALPNLALVLDFYNMEHMGEADRELTDWLPDIVHAHISDDDGSPFRRSYLKPEKADLHQRRIKRLLQAGYRGGISLEIDCPMDRERAALSLEILREAGA